MQKEVHLIVEVVTSLRGKQGEICVNCTSSLGLTSHLMGDVCGQSVRDQSWAKNPVEKKKKNQTKTPQKKGGGAGPSDFSVSGSAPKLQFGLCLLSCLCIVS